MVGRIDRVSHINWNQVFYFSQIAAAGSMKAAAEKLRLSSSTLSEHLAQLEAELCVKLFQRQHRKLALTSEGARLFQYARQMFETGKGFIDVISPIPLGCYPVSVGMVPGSSFDFAYNMLQRYLREYRELSLNVVSIKHEQLENALIEARMDFGFTDRRSERKNIMQVPVVTSELTFFASKKVADMPLREILLRMPLVLCRSERIGRSAVEEVLDSLDLNPRNIVISEYPSFVKHLCREGLGIAVLGKSHFDDDPTMTMLDLPREFPCLVERLYVTWTLDSENAEAIAKLKSMLDRTPRSESRRDCSRPQDFSLDMESLDS